MSKRNLLLVSLLLTAMMHATTPVTGSLKDLSTGVVQKNAKVRLWLRGCGGNQPRVLGTALIGPTLGTSYYKEFLPDVNGLISGTVYSTRDAAGTGNGDIDCGGSKTAAWYGVQIFVNGVGGTEVPVHAKSGVTLDLTSVVPLSVTPVATAPTGDATYLRLDGGNNPLASLTITGTETVGNLNAVRIVDGTKFATINAAENDCGTANCIVIIPSTFACGSGQSLLAKDNITVWDLRQCTSPQSTSGHVFYSVKDTNNGAVRDKMMVVDAFSPANDMAAASSSASFYTHAFAEGNLATFATLEALNGTITVDTGATNTPTVVAGIEGEALVSGTAANTVNDVRGGTFNVGVAGSGNIANATALVAQTVTNTGTGTISNAIGFKCENQTVGTVSNLCFWSQGKNAIDGQTSMGSFTGGITPQAGTMLFVRPQAGQLTGGIQIGVQSAPITSSGATSIGIGVISRADLGSAFTQAQNTAFEAQTPTLNGGTITRYTAFKADTPPAAGALCLYEFGGATSGTTCLNAAAVAAGTITLPAATGTALVTGNGASPVQTKRGVTGCATAASVGATCQTTITWTTAFADANYTVVGCVGNGVASGFPVINAIGSKIAASISVQTAAVTAAAAQYTAIECAAVHD